MSLFVFYTSFSSTPSSVRKYLHPHLLTVIPNYISTTCASFFRISWRCILNLPQNHLYWFVDLVRQHFPSFPTLFCATKLLTGEVSTSLRLTEGPRPYQSVVALLSISKLGTVPSDVIFKVDWPWLNLKTQCVLIYRKYMLRQLFFLTFSDIEQ